MAGKKMSVSFYKKNSEMADWYLGVQKIVLFSMWLKKKKAALEASMFAVHSKVMAFR